MEETRLSTPISQTWRTRASVQASKSWPLLWPRKIVTLWIDETLEQPPDRCQGIILTIGDRQCKTRLLRKIGRRSSANTPTVCKIDADHDTSSRATCSASSSARPSRQPAGLLIPVVADTCIDFPDDDFCRDLLSGKIFAYDSIVVSSLGWTGFRDSTRGSSADLSEFHCVGLTNRHRKRMSWRCKNTCWRESATPFLTSSLSAMWRRSPCDGGVSQVGCAAGGVIHAVVQLSTQINRRKWIQWLKTDSFLFHPVPQQSISVCLDARAPKLLRGSADQSAFRRRWATRYAHDGRCLPRTWQNSPSLWPRHKDMTATGFSLFGIRWRNRSGGLALLAR